MLCRSDFEGDEGLGASERKKRRKRDPPSRVGRKAPLERGMCVFPDCRLVFLINDCLI